MLDNSLPIESWREIFKDFQQVKSVKIDSSVERLDIVIHGGNEILNASREELDDALYKFKGNPHEVATSFLKNHGILVYYQNTLVGFFDIQAYSKFIERSRIEEAIQKINNCFSEIKSTAMTDALAVKLDHWILSDSIILAVDTNRHPLFSGSLEVFFGTCSMIMEGAISHN